jgi:hypothetical protein
VSPSFYNKLRAAHHTDNTSPILWVRSRHVTAVYSTPKTLNNFNFHHFIIIHSYSILNYYSTVKTCNRNPPKVAAPAEEEEEDTF